MGISQMVRSLIPEVDDLENMNVWLTDRSHCAASGLDDSHTGLRIYVFFRPFFNIE